MSTCQTLLSVGNGFLDWGQRLTGYGVDLGVAGVVGIPFTDGASLALLEPAGLFLEAGGLMTAGGDLINSGATGNYGPLIWNQFSNMAKGAAGSVSAEILMEITGAPLDQYMMAQNPYRCE